MGFMVSLFDLQRWLYSGAVDALNLLHKEGMSQFPTLVGSAFLFGLIHALLPGHGKSVLSAFYINGGRWAEAVGASAILILAHVGIAIIIVLSGWAILERTLVGAGRAIAIERTSQILIVLIGLWMLWRTFRPHHHPHHPKARSGFILGFVAGLVPCPLTAFIMTSAVGKGAIFAGLILSASFAAGMIVTVAAFPLAAVFARDSFSWVLERTSGMQAKIARITGLASSMAIIAVGLWPLLASRL